MTHPAACCYGCFNFYSPPLFAEATCLVWGKQWERCERVNDTSRLRAISAQTPQTPRIAAAPVSACDRRPERAPSARGGSAE